MLSLISKLTRNQFDESSALSRKHNGRPISTFALLGCMWILTGLLSMKALAEPGPEPLTPCAAEPTDMNLNFGDLVDCAIESGDSDLFRFNGKSNSVVVLSLFHIWSENCRTWGECTVANVYGPDNNLILTLTTSATSSLAVSELVTLTATGTYTIRAHSDIDGVSSYRIGLERLFPTSPTGIKTDFGESNVASIDPALDQDFYTFQGGKESHVILSLGGWDVKGQLYAPDKTLLDTLSSESKEITLPQTGIYTFHFYHKDNAHVSLSAYNFNLQCMTPGPGFTDCKGTPDNITCNGLTPTKRGTAKNERIVGTPGDDVIVGLGGNDRISGLGGNDVICGNSDNAIAGGDTLLGGDGNDILIGASNGTLFGDAGNDVLLGGKYRDALFGGTGNDTLDAKSGDDVLIGGAGDDVVKGGTGSNDVCDKGADDTTPATGCEIKDAP